MQLLSDIINELVDNKISLAAPLLKTKVLAYRLNNSLLVEWVDSELEGYEDIVSLPPYRIAGASLSMDYINGFHQVNNQAVPLNGLPEKVVSLLTEIRFAQSIEAIEAFATADSSGTLENPIPADIIRVVQNNIKKIGNNPHLQILSLTKTAPVNSAIGVISAVRKRLLGFMLQIEREFGDVTDVISLRDKNQQITTIMYNTINNTGHGNVINTGNEAKIDAKINIQQQNFENLASELRANGITDADISELGKIIDNDPVDRESRRFGPLVNEWTKKMLGKALDGSWQIGVGAAGGMLTELLKAYYEMGN